MVTFHVFARVKTIAKKLEWKLLLKWKLYPTYTEGNEQPVSNTMKSYMPATYKHYNKQ